jgi:hypothetical protein
VRQMTCLGAAVFAVPIVRTVSLALSELSERSNCCRVVVLARMPTEQLRRDDQHRLRPNTGTFAAGRWLDGFSLEIVFDQACSVSPALFANWIAALSGDTQDRLRFSAGLLEANAALETHSAAYFAGTILHQEDL